MVDFIKYENIDLFAKIENSAQKNEESQLINEIELNPQLRPAELTVNSTFIDYGLWDNSCGSSRLCLRILCHHDHSID